MIHGGKNYKMLVPSTFEKYDVCLEQSENTRETWTRPPCSHTHWEHDCSTMHRLTLTESMTVQQCTDSHSLRAWLFNNAQTHTHWEHDCSTMHILTLTESMTVQQCTGSHSLRALLFNNAHTHTHWEHDCSTMHRLC